MEAGGLTPGFERGYTRGRYGQMHYMSGGQGSAPTLVLLHQNPASILEYRTLAAEMAKDRRVVAFDMPGQGLSDPPPEPQLIDAYAAAYGDAIEALDLAKNGKVDVFGFHTGTLMGADLAIQRPDLIGRVILSGIPYRTPQERAERLAEAKKPHPLDEDGAGLFNTMRTWWDGMVKDRPANVPLDRAAEHFLDKIKPMERSYWPYFGVWSYDIEEQFPKITQPVLVPQTHEHLLENSRKAAAFIPNATFVELPGVSKHVLDAGAPDFGAAIRAWRG